ncbi:hypothetical protein HF633_12100, partial [Weissella cibaria]|nr:hypothetical protein [Weissella cibaria]
SYIDREQLSAEWESITGDSKIVDVRRLKPKNGEMAEAFCEVFKYALKFSELSLADNVEAFDVFHGKRLQGSFGCLWGVKVPEKMTDDLLPDLPYLELFYRYDRHKGYDLANVEHRSPAAEQLEALSNAPAEAVSWLTGEVRDYPRQGLGAARSRSEAEARTRALDGCTTITLPRGQGADPPLGPG